METAMGPLVAVKLRISRNLSLHDIFQILSPHDSNMTSNGEIYNVEIVGNFLLITLADGTSKHKYVCNQIRPVTETLK
jgi:hypothetical protein